MKLETQVSSQEQGQDLMAGLAEWREKHPSATLREIKVALDERLFELRVSLLSETVYQSQLASWETGSQAVLCPKCGQNLEEKGKKKRKMQTQSGREIELEREYGVRPQ
jgi:hypothetical protein